MRNLQTWEPFNELWRLQDDLDSFLSFGGRKRRGKEDGEMVMWTPRMDIYEDKESLKVYADLPGLTKKDVAINVEDNILTIKGERKFEEEEKKDNYCRVERAYGTFRRSFTLPNNVDTNAIKASMKDGTLTVTIAKKEEAKPKEVEIEVS